MSEVELYLTYDGSSGPDQIRECFQKYYSFLTAQRERFPAGALSFAEAPWHYEPTDARCPHDSWLESFQLYEALPKDQVTEVNSVEIQLLGAYHDRRIFLRYQNVRYYSLVKLPTPVPPNEGHGDWLLDEVSITNEDVVVHTIHWATGAQWQIWCDDLHYSWSLENENKLC